MKWMATTTNCIDNPRPQALQQWCGEKKRNYFSSTSCFCFYFYFSSSFSRATKKATHYMIANSKTHKSAQPKC
jgi:hypothetical protein